MGELEAVHRTEATAWLESLDGRAALPVGVTKVGTVSSGYRFTWAP